MANSVEMLSGKKKKDYAAESAADALAAQAASLGLAPDATGFGETVGDADDDEDDEVEAIGSADEEELVAA